MEINLADEEAFLKYISSIPNFNVPLFNHANVFLVQDLNMFNEILLFCNGTMNSFQDSMPENYFDGATFAATIHGEYYYIIGIFNDDVSILVHELDHYAFFVHRDIGIDLSEDFSNETHAYLIQHAFREFSPSIKKIKKRG